MSEAITLVCKICGGEFVLPAGTMLFPCPACGTPHSRPRAAGSLLADLRRAHQQRSACDFTNAAVSYQRVLNVHPDEAEALWGLALCRYGVEYVQDEKSQTLMPIVHFLNRRPFTEDPDCLLAIARADRDMRPRYEQDADYIARIQQEVLAAEQRGDACDVFLCYKASVPGSPDRYTREFNHAQNLYFALREAGYSVFFAHTTLRRAAGANYEAQIYHALHSARVMLVIVSDPDYLDTPWVHSEWSRYLERIDAHEDCRLIPLLYNGCDPYALPDAFLRRSLQGLDMSPLTALDDLRKILDERLQRTPAAAAPATAAPASATAPLLRRAMLFLEDGEWQDANAYCEKVLDADPECARAYLGKLMAALQVRKPEALRDQPKSFEDHPDYKKALRFADKPLADELRGMIAHINERNERAVKEAAYNKAAAALAAAKTDADFETAGKLFKAVGDFSDVREKIALCETKRLDWLYEQADAALQRASSEADFMAAGKLFSDISGHRDADERAKECETKRLDWLYEQAANTMKRADSEQAFAEAQKQFEALGSHRDAAEKAMQCSQLADVMRKNKIYTHAIQTFRSSPNASGCTYAIKLFQMIPGWKDADQQAAKCQQMILDIAAREEANRAERQRKEEAEQLARLKAEQKKKRFLGISAAAICIVIAAVLLVTHVIIPPRMYNAAVAYEAEGNTALAAIHFGKAGSYKDARVRSNALWDGIAERHTLSAGYNNTVGLRPGGSVNAVGSNGSGQCDVSGWSDIVAISAGSYHTVGLRANGSVVAVGHNSDGRCNVSGWSDIVAISAGDNHTVGLRQDGTVVAVGYNYSGQCNVSGWSDIVAISAGGIHTVGLRQDGTVVAVGANGYGQCNVSGWKNIVAISAGAYHTVGLRSDGTVIAVGDNSSGQCEVSDWSDIVAISAGSLHTIGLCSNGTVIAVGSNSSGQCNFPKRSDIVAISAGGNHTVGLRSDGSVVTVGDNYHGQRNVTNWTLRVPD